MYCFPLFNKEIIQTLIFGGSRKSMANKSSPSPESIQTQSLIINLPQIFKLVGITHTHTHTQEHK
jgi:hypothetical protein